MNKFLIGYYQIPETQLQSETTETPHQKPRTKSLHHQ